MAVSDFLGIPYRLNGRDRSGTDCLGLVLMYLCSLGMKPPYGDGLPIDADWRQKAETRLTSWFSRHARAVPTPAQGDVALFRTRDGTMHLGVMVDGESVLHILEDRASMLTPLRRLRRMLVGVYRL